MPQAPEQGPRKNGKGTGPYVYKAMQVKAQHDLRVKKHEQKKQSTIKLEAFQQQILKSGKKSLRAHRFV